MFRDGAAHQNPRPALGPEPSELLPLAHPYFTYASAAISGAVRRAF
jgi:hypothetical protein